MTVRREPGLVQRALAGHAAIGVLAAALIYILSLSGTLVVIHDRWQRWEQPDAVETAALSPAAAQAAMVAGIAAERGKPPTTHLYLRMPTEELPRAVLTTDHGARYVDAGGRLAGPEAHAWTEFVIALHEYLHLPTTWGLLLVGALGVALAALAITGVVAHPRILRDAFRLRTRQDPQLARADWHNRLGVWSLPFALALALTGALIGLGSLGFTALAKGYHGGDMAAAYAPVFGDEPAPNKAAAPLPDIAGALTTLAARAPHATPTYVIVHDPGTRGQHVQIIADIPRRLIYGETYAFAADGGWRGAVGLADGALGKQVAASAYKLHFGNYGGLPIEVAYMALGLALCVVTATGTAIWLSKRRRRGLPTERLAASWAVVTWGTPLLIATAWWLRAIAGPAAPLVGWFWIGLAAMLALAALRPAAIAAIRPRLAALLLCAITGAMHLAWYRPAIGGVIAIDLILVAAPLAALALLRAHALTR